MMGSIRGIVRATCVWLMAVLAACGGSESIQPDAHTCTKATAECRQGTCDLIIDVDGGGGAVCFGEGCCETACAARSCNVCCTAL